MSLRPLVSALLLLQVLQAGAQELLPEARVRARGMRRDLPALGLPLRTDGDYDQIIYLRERQWFGADSLKARPHWSMWTATYPLEAGPDLPGPIRDLCRAWTAEKPGGPVYVVTGPLQDGRFVALCTRTRSLLGWKSLAFLLPLSGPSPEKSVYEYSCSVNRLEYLIGYDLYPRLPAHLQERVEEITATELLCPFQEFDLGLDEHPEPEVDYDREEDYREM